MLNSLINLIFPKICYGCKSVIGENIDFICLSCRTELARHHLNFPSNNPVEKFFWGRLKLEKATSFLKFEKNGRIQSLLHALKYKGVKDIGILLGELASTELTKTTFFDDIDLLLPIPIHEKKQKKRGYNQSHCIAKGIANVTAIDIDKASIIKELNTESQTKKNRFNRYLNPKNSFKLVNEGSLINRHILLIDDVITTGGTIEACGAILKDIPGVRLSLLTIACTY